MHIRFSLSTKFQCKLTILFFCFFVVFFVLFCFVFLFYLICPKRVFPVENRKIARSSMVVTYYIKLSHKGADRHNSILMSLLLLVAETMMTMDYNTENYEMFHADKLSHDSFEVLRGPVIIRNE